MYVGKCLCAEVKVRINGPLIGFGRNIKEIGIQKVSVSMMVVLKTISRLNLEIRIPRIL